MGRGRGDRQADSVSGFVTGCILMSVRKGTKNCVQTGMGG